MDDGNGKCHPEHLIAKLPTKTDAEIEAEVASWGTTERRLPDVKLNHLYVVLGKDDFEAIRQSDLIVNQLAASDQGFPSFYQSKGPASPSICEDGTPI